MARAGKSLLRSSGLRASADDLGRGQKLRAAADQCAALAGALPENLLTRHPNQAVLRCANGGDAPRGPRVRPLLPMTQRDLLVRLFGGGGGDVFRIEMSN